MEPNAAQTRTLRQMEKHKVKLWAPDKKKSVSSNQRT